MCSVICNLHTKSALTSSAGITGPVKSTQAGLQRRKPNHIRLFLRIRNTTSPCPPQFNTNSLAVRVLVLGLSQRPSGEVTKLGVLGQKTSAGKKGDPSVTTKWSGGLRQRPVGDGGGGPSRSFPARVAEPHADLREPRTCVSPSGTGTKCI